MYLSTVALFALAHVASVRAQDPTYGFDTLTNPSSGSSFAVGSMLPIVWQAGTSTGTVSIELNGGATPATLNHLMTVGTSISSQAGGYNWTIPSSVGSFATYGLNLTLDSGSEFQESYPFHITGGSDSSSNSGVSSSSTSSSGTSLVSSTSTSSASASGTVSTTTASGSTVVVVQSTPQATFPSTTSAGTTFTSSVSNSASNGTASKTSSSKSSSTSSASISSATSSGASAKFISGSLAALSALIFAFAL